MHVSVGLHVCKCTIYVPDPCGCQTTVSDPLKLESRVAGVTRECQNLNLGSLEEHQMLLIAEPSLRLHPFF